LPGKDNSVNVHNKQIVNTNLVVIDTNIFIYLVSSKLSFDIIPINKNVVCPSIVMIETLGYQHITVAEEKKLRDLILGQCIIAPLDGDIVERAINIRQENKIKVPDAITAATAIEHRATLWTHNIKDFAGIKGLRLHDPLEPNSQNKLS